MYQPEQYRLDQTRDVPCYFGAAEEHGEPLKEETAEQKLFAKIPLR